MIYRGILGRRSKLKHSTCLDGQMGRCIHSLTVFVENSVTPKISIEGPRDRCVTSKRKRLL